MYSVHPMTRIVKPCYDVARLLSQLGHDTSTELITNWPRLPAVTRVRQRRCRPAAESFRTRPRNGARASMCNLNGLVIANVSTSLIRLLHDWMITFVKHRFVLRGGHSSSIVDMQRWQWNSVKTKACWWKCELCVIICRMSRHAPWGRRRDWR